jgi:hypothetical protein
VAWLRADRVERPEDDLCFTLRNVEIGLLQLDPATTPATDRFERDSMGRDCDGDHFDDLARRSDLVTGVDRFSFLLDDEFGSTLSGAVQVKITFLDTSMTSFGVVSSTAESDAIDTVGDGEVRTATFEVLAADLADGFEVVVLGDEDLVVRLVRLVRT